MRGIAGAEIKFQQAIEIGDRSDHSHQIPRVGQVSSATHENANARRAVLHEKFRTDARPRYVERRCHYASDTVKVRRVNGLPVDMVLQSPQISDVGDNGRANVDLQMHWRTGDGSKEVGNDHPIIPGLIGVHIAQNQRIGG